MKCVFLKKLLERKNLIKDLEIGMVFLMALLIDVP